MHTIVVGRRALLVDVEDSAAALALAAWARAQVSAGDLSADEIVPAARSVLFDGVADLDHLRERLAVAVLDDVIAVGELVEIPMRYDGPDLTDIAQRWGLSVDDAVRTHAKVEYLSAFCGFAPGFSYLAGLPEELWLPRLDTPRARVPAGAVGLAGEWCAAYPTASPGGWRLLGHTDARLWDATRQPPALLPPGTRVRFLPQ